MSSIGLLTAPPAFERLRSLRRLLRDLAPEEVAAAAAPMRAEIAATLRTEEAALRFRYVAEMWHQGQEYPLEVPLGAEELGPALPALLQQRFAAAYAELYGRAGDETPLEVASLRVIGEQPQEGRIATTVHVPGTRRLMGRRRFWEPRQAAFIEVDVLDRAALVPGEQVGGPVVVQERESGFAIREGDRLTVHPSGAIFVELG